jgi:hypothetical protein
VGVLFSGATTITVVRSLLVMAADASKGRAE